MLQILGMRTASGLVILSMLILASPSRGDDKKSTTKPPIPAIEAKDHVDEEVTVLMTVRLAKNSTREKCYFLDSEADYKDPKNFCTVIDYKYAKKFSDAGIADPVAEYDKKTITVTGTVIKQGKQTRIRVTDPKQIVILEAKKTP